MSEHKGRVLQSLDRCQLAVDTTGLADRNQEAHAGSAALSGGEAPLALDQKPKVATSLRSASRCASPIDLALSDDEDLYNPLTTRWHTTLCSAISTNKEHQNALGFSSGYEPLLKGLLSSNISTIREGFTILQSCNLEIRKIHDIEQFDTLFSMLSRREDAPVPRSTLCEMCAVAATSGQYVRHLLGPGLINYWYSKIHSWHLVSRMNLT